MFNHSQVISFTCRNIFYQSQSIIQNENFGRNGTFLMWVLDTLEECLKSVRHWYLTSAEVSMLYRYAVCTTGTRRRDDYTWLVAWIFLVAHYDMFFSICWCFKPIPCSFIGKQIKEMGGRNKPSDISKVSEQPSEKKKGFVDWVNLMKPSNEEKDHWVRFLMPLCWFSKGVLVVFAFYK